jgi:hypothetical protein
MTVESKEQFPMGLIPLQIGSYEQVAYPQKITAEEELILKVTGGSRPSRFNPRLAVGRKVLLFPRWRPLLLTLAWLREVRVVPKRHARPPLRNNSSLQLSEETSKYQANDRGCYRSLVNISFGGYRFGARGYFHSHEPRASSAPEEENRSESTDSAV